MNATPALFLDASNLRPLCKSCHDSHRVPNPSERQQLIWLFRDWTKEPRSEFLYAKLTSAMVDFELKSRLRQAIPLPR